MIDLSEQINKRLEEYTDEVIDAVGEATTETGKVVVDSLKKTSPVKTGKYAKGWRAKPGADQRNVANVIVHNATDWQLTHLLEHGHLKRGGTGRVAARPHIAKAESLAKEELEKRIREKLS